MSNYIQLLKTTPEVFKNTNPKNENTLYFVIAKGESAGKLFLGNKEIILSQEINNQPTSLLNLQLPEILLQNQILAYEIDPNGEEYWTAKNLNELVKYRFSENDFTTAYKNKLDGLHNTTIDSKFSLFSANPVENKVVTEVVQKLNNQIQDLSQQVTQLFNDRLVADKEIQELNLNSIYQALQRMEKQRAQILLDQELARGRFEEAWKGKVDAAEGLGLSANSFTDENKDKLSKLPFIKINDKLITSDTLSITSGSNISLLLEDNNKLTINATADEKLDVTSSNAIQNKTVALELQNRLQELFNVNLTTQNYKCDNKAKFYFVTTWNSIQGTFTHIINNSIEYTNYFYTPKASLGQDFEAVILKTNIDSNVIEFSYQIGSMFDGEGYITNIIGYY